MLIYLDTKFTTLGREAELLSLGLVSEDGQHQLYLEVSDYREKASSAFVVERVLPHFGKDPAALCDYLAISGRIRAWAATVPGKHVIACDSNIDALLLTWALASGWPSNIQFSIERIEPVFDPVEWELSVVAYFEAHPHHIRHHALHDACALRWAHRRLILGCAPEDAHD